MAEGSRAAGTDCLLDKRLGGSMENVKVIEIGLGEVVSNWGTYEGKPALFIEPVTVAGVVGQHAPDGPKHEVQPNSTIIRFHSPAGALVLMEDMLTAINRGGDLELSNRALQGGERRDGYRSVLLL
jgi:hypothetical protein